MADHWNEFEVESFDYQDDAAHPTVGEEYDIRIVIDRKGLKSMLGVEIVYTKENPENHQTELVTVAPFTLKKEVGSKLYFELHKKAAVYGHMRVGFRVYPVNPKLPHRMDFAYVRWIQP